MDATQMTDAVLSAGAEVAEWQREFMQVAVGEVMKQRARLQWARMTPEMREALKQAAPEQYAQIERMIEQKGR